MLSGENGILQRATDAKEGTEKSALIENVKLDILAKMAEKSGQNLTDVEIKAILDDYFVNTNAEVDNADLTNKETTLTSNVGGYEITIGKLLTGVTVASESDSDDGDGKMPTETDVTKLTTAVDKNTQYKDVNEDIAVIPKGFRVSSHKDSNDKYDEQTIETGLVVLDGNNNEWVWIPVPDASVMYTKNDAGIAITGGPDLNVVSGVATNYYSNTILSNITRGLPNVTSSNYREPDVVVYTDGIRYDAVEANRTTAGFIKTIDGTTTTMTLSEMAQSLVDDYEEMVKSVAKNHGFYVGRYELKGTDINNAEEKAGVVMTTKNWYKLYYACKHINTGTATVGAVEPRMIWGCQWDIVCNFIANHGDKKNIDSSSDWGNYSNSTGNASISGKSGSKQDTGFSPYWCANKIYDIAGNCWEWTQDAYNSYSRVRRGGDHKNNGSVRPASYRFSDNPTDSFDSTSSRPQLYIK